jgi:hypothetical protein
MLVVYMIHRLYADTYVLVVCLKLYVLVVCRHIQQ